MLDNFDKSQLGDILLQTYISKLCFLLYFRTAYVQYVVEDLLNLYSKLTHLSSIQLMCWKNVFVIRVIQSKSLGLYLHMCL